MSGGGLFTRTLEAQKRSDPDADPRFTALLAAINRSYRGELTDSSAQASRQILDDAGLLDVRGHSQGASGLPWNQPETTATTAGPAKDGDEASDGDESSTPAALIAIGIAAPLVVLVVVIVLLARRRS